MTVTLNLSPETERKLRTLATQAGRTVEEYVEELVKTDPRVQNGGAAGTPELSDEEFERLLDELSAGEQLPHLPADFSRADIYADHD